MSPEVSVPLWGGSPVAGGNGLLGMSGAPIIPRTHCTGAPSNIWKDWFKRKYTSGRHLIHKADTWSALNLMPKWRQLSKWSLVIQGVDEKYEQVCLIQPRLVDVGDKYEMHEFLLVPICDCNHLGRELMTTLGIKNIIKGDTEANTFVTLCKFSD